MEIPNVGKLLIRNNLCAVEFNEFLYKDTLVINNC